MSWPTAELFSLGRCYAELCLDKQTVSSKHPLTNQRVDAGHMHVSPGVEYFLQLLLDCDPDTIEKEL
jgi:hypothetical protein